MLHGPGDCPFGVTATATSRGDIGLHLHNGSERTLPVTVRDASYGRSEISIRVVPGGTQELLWDLQPSHHWYDLIVSVEQHQWRLAGHVEDTRESVSDPANAAPVLS
jgi:phospholipase C